MASDLRLFGRGAKPELLLVQGDSCRTEMCCRLRFTTDEVNGGANDANHILCGCGPSPRQLGD